MAKNVTPRSWSLPPRSDGRRYSAPPITAPTGVAAAASGSNANVTWSASTSALGTISGYDVHMNGVKHNSSLVTAQPYTITNPPQNVQHTIAVRALDSAGNQSALSESVPFTLSSGGGSVAPEAQPLLQQSALQYLGAFRSANTGHEDYGGISYDPETNKIFGIDGQRGARQFTIPTPVNSTNWANLPTPTTLQSVADATGGKFGQLTSNGSTDLSNLAGTLVFGSELLLSGLVWYDGGDVHRRSHFRRPKNLSAAASTVQDAVRLGNTGNAQTGGRAMSKNMAWVPEAWRSLVGGAAFVTGAGMSTVNSGPASFGPSAFFFNPTAVGVTTPVPGHHLLYYPFTENEQTTLPVRMGHNGVYNVANAYWSYVSSVGGCVWPVGTRSVLFFGSHGTGPSVYNPGGFNAAPHRYQVWAYDANDFVRVRNGEIHNHQVEPYAIWVLSFPLMPTNVNIGLDWYVSGVAYDAATQRLWVRRVGVFTAGNWQQLIDVFQINIP